MANDTLKNLDGKNRRRFLQFAAAAGAVFALDRAKVLDVVSDSAGSAMADDMCAASNRSVHIIAGNGGFAWFNLLWPHLAIATSNNQSFAYHAQGKSIKAKDTDKDFYFSPESPWQDLDKTKRISAFMAGTNQTHTTTPGSAATIGGMQSMLAAVAAIQKVTPSLLPVIGINPVQFGSAPGAPDIALVGDADGMVQLFNSAASRAILEVPEDASLYEAHYKAFLSLSKASARSTVARQLRIGKSSANFLGKNLAAQLAPSADDLTRYGIDGNTATKLSEIGKALITAVKAFKLGLTQSVILPAMMDDPHGAFQDMNVLQDTVSTLGGMLDAFMLDLAAIKDPACTNHTLADTTVMTIHGDTPKDPFTASGWPDGTPNNANWLYVMGNGWLKTGWFGGVKPDGSSDGFDPSTGAVIAGQASNVTSAPAGAAVLYAIARGDMRRVRDFYAGPALDGIINKPAP
jgi:hypothetical protein